MISMSYPALTAFFCSSIFERSSSVIVCFIVFIASFWSTGLICIVTTWLDSIDRKSASSLSLKSDASIERKLMPPYKSPILKYLPVGNAKLLGAIKSFTESPEPVRYFQSK